MRLYLRRIFKYFCRLPDSSPISNGNKIFLAIFLVLLASTVMVQTIISFTTHTKEGIILNQFIHFNSTRHWDKTNENRTDETKTNEFIIPNSFNSTVNGLFHKEIGTDIDPSPDPSPDPGIHQIAVQNKSTVTSQFNSKATMIYNHNPILDMISAKSQDEYSKNLDRLPIKLISNTSINTTTSLNVASQNPLLLNTTPRIRLGEDGKTNRLQFIHKPIFCQRQGLLTVLVLTTSKDFNKRQTIRQTWGNWMNPIFFFGKPIPLTIQHQIDREVDKYQDILQGTFQEAESISISDQQNGALLWIESTCESTYVLQIQDDVFVNIPKLLDFLRHIELYNLL